MTRFKVGTFAANGTRYTDIDARASGFEGCPKEMLGVVGAKGCVVFSVIAASEAIAIDRAKRKRAVMEKARLEAEKKAVEAKRTAATKRKVVR